MDTSWICRVDREWRRSMTWSSGWTHERGQGCAAKSQSRTTIENGESPTSSGIALESPIGRESRSHLVAVALSRHEIAWLRPEKVQEGETLRRVCGEARRKRNESCSRNRGPESRRSYQRLECSAIYLAARLLADRRCWRRRPSMSTATVSPFVGFLAQFALT